MTTKLSLTKFKNLIESRKVTIDKILLEDHEIRFVLCKTILRQKTFAIYVSPKYSFKGYLTSNIVQITKTPQSSLPFASRQLEYLSGIRGNKFPYDTLSLSSGVVLHYKQDNPTFYITPEFHEEESSSEEESGDDFVTKLEKKSSRIKKKIERKELFPQKKNFFSKTKKNKRKKNKHKQENKESSSESLSNPEESSSSSSSSSSKSEESSSSFETKKSNHNKKSKHNKKVTTSDDSEVSENSQKSELENEKSESGTSEDKSIEEIKFQKSSSSSEVDSVEGSSSGASSEDLSDDLKINNSVPNTMREKDVVIGVIYVCVDMSVFLKKSSKFEEEINESYNAMSLNETNLRMERLKKIKDRCYFMVKKAEENLLELEDKEKKIKEGLARLTIVLAQSDALKERIAKNPKKYIEEEDAATEVRDQTYKTIGDLNVELLTIRDSADELLINCGETIEDLIEDLTQDLSKDLTKDLPKDLTKDL